MCISSEKLLGLGLPCSDAPTYAIVRDSRAGEDDSLEIDVLVGEDSFDGIPVKSLLGLGVAAGSASSIVASSSLMEEVDIALLICIEPATGKRWCIWEEDEGGDATKDRDDALNDEDPSPALKSTKTIHLSNCGSQETRECTGSCRGEVEDSSTTLGLVWRIPV